MAPDQNKKAEPPTQLEASVQVLKELYLAMDQQIEVEEKAKAATAATREKNKGTAAPIRCALGATWFLELIKDYFECAREDWFEDECLDDSEIATVRQFVALIKQNVSGGFNGGDEAFHEKIESFCGSFDIQMYRSPSI